MRDMWVINEVESQAELFGVFANATRIRILQAMTQSELSVGGIAKRVGVSLQTTSHHLRYMKDKGILKSRREGQHIRYSIACPDLVSMLLSAASQEMGDLAR